MGQSQLSYRAKVGMGNSKAFLYNLELLLTFLQPCYSTFKISDLFLLSIDIHMVSGLLVYFWMNAASPIVRLTITDL